jgi:hypothetical protein
VRRQPAIEIAQTGHSFPGVADYHKQFSSLAASLLIGKKLFIDVTHATSGTEGSPIFEHNFGFPPVFFPMRRTSAGSLEYFMGADFDITVDERYVYALPNGLGAPNTTVGLMLFQRSITESYTSQLASPINRSRAKQSDVVMKVMRDGHTIQDRDPRNASVDTDYKTLLVHKSGVITHPNADPDGFEIIEHKLRYQPLFFLYFAYDQDSGAPEAGRFRQLLGAVGTGVVSGVHKVDNNNLHVYKTLSGQYAYLILKDPIV